MKKDWQGWFRRENMEVLSRFKGSPVVEIGCWKGVSAKYLLDQDPARTLYCIDTWLGSESLNDGPWGADLPTLFDQFKHNLQDYEARLHVVHTDSLTGLGLLKQRSVKPVLIYIDGGHSKYQVCGDVATSLESFRGADLVGDDWGLPGVNQGVRLALALTESERELRHSGGCWWLE